MTGSQRPYLRLISSVSDETANGLQKKASAPARELLQPMLFSDASLHTLGFIKASELDGDKFTSLIREARPRVVFDLRPVPSFARRALSRKAVFSLFEENGVKYFDVAGMLGVSSGRDGLLNPALLVDALQVNVLRHARGLSGPVFFFVDDDLFYEEYFSAVAKQLPNQDGRGWDIACWPNQPTPEVATDRDLVFISHANPEDNEVALWLASRLAASGYQVWSDITRLIGGEYFWDTIEDAIRKRAAKVIVILSRRGQQKPGLLDEINVAVATERGENLSRFVIPVRIDDLPFADVRANLARKNIIDGHTNLAGALSRIVTILREDKVPFTQSNQELSGLNIRLNRQEDADQSEWSVLVENKLEVLDWPHVIRKFRSPHTTFPFAAHAVTNGLVTFEDWDVIEETLGKPVVKAGEARFDLNDSSNAAAVIFANRAEARRAATSIMRQAWERICEHRGFIRFVLANNSSCWFLPSGFQSANRVRYPDPKGVERQKILVGQSPRRRVFWHFAVEARPSPLDQSIRVIPHVVFSDDGRTPIPSHDRQHALRRGFCRNWWNARWRDLLLATLSYLADGHDTLGLPVSQRANIKVSARLKMHLVEPSMDDLGTATSGEVIRFEEPKVAVGYGQENDSPKEGLLLFGPVSFERNPKNIRAGVIGTTEGIELFRVWSRQFNTFQSDPKASRNAISFPGFEAVFGAKWNVQPVHSIALSRTDLINAILLQDRHQAIFRSSGMYVDEITKAVREDDLNVDIWFVVIPDEVFVYGRPASRVPSAMAIATPSAMGRSVAKRFLESSPSLFPEDNAEARIYDHHLDFHHQLKARLLDVQAVTQVLRESSLASVTADPEPESLAATELLPNQEDIDDAEAIDNEERPTENGVPSGGVFEDGLNNYDDEMHGLRSDPSLDIFGARFVLNRHMQDKASVAWNLSTAAFFKAGGRPWKVANARQGVCYIGLIFKRDPNARSRQACCGAQMFLQDGDGLVFKGAMGPWYSPETGQFHISRAEAKRLISTVLASYAKEHSDPPQELFIHGRTRFNSEEWSGFCDAIDISKTRLTAVRITRSNEYKLFSSGERAVRRGTALRLNSRIGLLWTSGYIERLGTYPGRETPNPLRVEIVNATDIQTKIDVVMSDIIMLTKMNFNSCIYGDGIPVTMRFADAIGDVLMTARDKKIPPLPFRYYI